jgi:hypothetical protein
MSKNTLLIRLFGTMALSILFIAATTYADQYYDQYQGNCFVPYDEDTSYEKTWTGRLLDDDTSDPFYFCPVNFCVPDGSVHFIKSIGVRFKDNLTDGALHVSLVRRNIYTGNYHTVAAWASNHSAASDSDQSASQGTNAGYKLVDAKKFSYWLKVWFAKDGFDSPHPNLVLIQVRIHYGT